MLRLSILTLLLALVSLAAACGSGADAGGETGSETGPTGDTGATGDAGPMEADAVADASADAVTTGGDHGGPVPAPDAEADVDDTTFCPDQTHWDEATGLCQPDVCTKGAATCADLATIKACDDQGAGFEKIPCPEGETCFGGQCWVHLCEPGETGQCDGNAVLKCNSLGIEWVPFPCPPGNECKDSECVPIPPNVILLVDTSGSMNWLPDGSAPDSCVGAGCPPWSFPTCDDHNTPKTRLGRVKQALQSVLGGGAFEGMQVALQRFPQVPWYPNFFGTPTPECVGGYWSFNDDSLISGDTNAKVTPETGWFASGLDQILPVPFRPEGTDLDAIAAWFDGVETVSSTGPSCSGYQSCGGGPCLNSGCAEFTNPELRAIHGTPLGKSLFYAGEYLRHFVLLQGKACASDADCATPHHSCVDGACFDANAYCRPNVIIAFTDGEDTSNVHVTDFFHPRVQAKRLHYGLGCGVPADCVGDATCESNLCTPPPGVVDETAMVCETGGTPCTTTSQCSDPCGGIPGCQGQCLPAKVEVSEGGIADTVKDHSGVPVSITVHVVDASGELGKNQLVAAYGGGQHFSVELTTPEALEDTVQQLIVDTKSSCSQAP